VEVSGQHHDTVASPQREKLRYPMSRRLSRPQNRSRHFGREENPLPLPGFESRTVQPVSSPYTDYALRDPVLSLCARIDEFGSREWLNPSKTNRMWLLVVLKEWTHMTAKRAAYCLNLTWWLFRPTQALRCTFANDNKCVRYPYRHHI
jgi:hypothetical protein